MSLKILKPVTSSQRGVVLLDRKGIFKGGPLKSLSSGAKNKTGGRNNNGRITSRYIGGGHKKKYRFVDFFRNRFDVCAVVKRIEYDPNRTAFIALLEYEDGVFSYVVCPSRVQIGSVFVSSLKNVLDILPGNAMPLKNIPLGTLVHNVELKPGKGAQLARSAGSYAQLVGKDSGFAMLRLRSGEIRLVLIDCFAVIGSVSNSDHQNIKLGKAGRNRWKGKRPKVRGVAMNPVDHPHGGGEGKSSGGLQVTPYGKGTKGNRTRRNKKTDKMIIKKRYIK